MQRLRRMLPGRAVSDGGGSDAAPAGALPVAAVAGGCSYLPMRRAGRHGPGLPALAGARLETLVDARVAQGRPALDRSRSRLRLLDGRPAARPTPALITHPVPACKKGTRWGARPQDRLRPQPRSCKCARAAWYSAARRSTSTRVGTTALTAPIPCPQPQMSFQAFLASPPKFILEGSLCGN